MLNHVYDQIASTIEFHKNVIDVWTALKESFSKDDKIHLSSIRSSINNLMQSSKFVMYYFIELKGLWRKYNKNIPQRVCICMHMLFYATYSKVQQA